MNRTRKFRVRPGNVRLVVKSGSAVLSKKDGGLDLAAVRRLASQLVRLHRAGHEVILVTSGAIAAGVGRLGLSDKPTDLRLKQAAAAIGQLALMRAYEEAFAADSITPAQILLTREDLSDRERYLNIRNTVLRLLELRAIPIVNENDTVSTEEIQFGDNDTLSAIVATKVEADKLILLSDVPGLLRRDQEGELTKDVIPVVERVTADMEHDASKKSGTKLSVGGMATKIRAAKMATAAGIETWIGSGYEADTLDRILSGASDAGTCFRARGKKFESRHAWIAFGRNAKGSLIVDPGALKAVVESRKSLLPSGIKTVRGSFAVGDTVAIRSADGDEVARGLVNFSSDDVKKIKGRHTKDIAALIGEASTTEVIHRDNLVLL